MKISLTGAKPFTGKIIAETALFPQQLRGGGSSGVTPVNIWALLSYRTIDTTDFTIKRSHKCYIFFTGKNKFI